MKEHIHPARAIRQVRGESIEAAAHGAGLTTQSLWRYETGRTALRLDMLIRLADYYGVTLDALTGRSEVAS